MESGFTAFGVAPAVYDPVGHDRLLLWLRNGYQAGLNYMERADRKRYDPKIHLPEARSVMVFAFNYYTEPKNNPLKGYVSIYARGEDYHRVVKDKLDDLAQWISRTNGEFKYKIFVDTSPVSEKSLALKAGIGFLGRNGTIIIPRDKSKAGIPRGSYHFLGVIISDLDLSTDSPIDGTCGRCRKCIDACPTRAIVSDGVIDAGKCVSYHNTQNKGIIPDEIADGMRNMVFGCDICQIVCPYNNSPVITSENRLEPAGDLVETDLEMMSRMSETEFRNSYEYNAMSGISFEMFSRNISIATRNIDKSKNRY